MSSPIDKKTWEKAKEAYLSSSDSLAAIAMRFGISKRAVEKKASEEGWTDKRNGGSKKQVIEISLPTPKRNFRHRHQPEMDEIEIIDSAIASLSAVISSGEDTRSVGSCATSLCRLIELRNKLVPKTVFDLADMAVALDISPQEFVRALSDKWQQRA
jgi:hypothetical protein